MGIPHDPACLAVSDKLDLDDPDVRKMAEAQVGESLGTMEKSLAAMFALADEGPIRDKTTAALRALGVDLPT
jgi:hypothetical protein